MQDFEKLAHSVFENAEQQPPKEVWEGIEAKLRGSVAAPQKSHSWLWALGAGVVIAGVALFGIMKNNQNHTAEELAFVDTFIDVVETEESVVASTHTPFEKPVEAVKSQESNEASPVVMADKSTPTVNGNNDYEDEQFFDLLEYQLASHEYDIPSDEQSSKASVPQKNNSKPAISTKNEEPSDDAKKDSVEIIVLIPNILSPNGDGINDCWVIPDLAKYGKSSVQIFTAQRKRVYASDNYNGDFCGDDLPSGNYFYVLTLQKHNYVRRGVLVIQR